MTPAARERFEIRVGWRRLAVPLIFAVAFISIVYVVLPQVAGLDETWDRIQEGDPAWLALAALFEALSFAAYISLFRAVFSEAGDRIDWRASYEISLAGVVATRVFASAGIGGIWLTVWALRGAGMPTRTVVDRMTAFLVLLYGVFLAAALVAGLGLQLEIFAGTAPAGLTIVPAAIAVVAAVVAVTLGGLAPSLEQTANEAPRESGRRERVAAAVSVAAARVSVGVRSAFRLLLERRLRLIGALGWWAFDVAVLWASFQAFGEVPETAVVVMAYLAGMLGNLLPLPGGIGGVEGGMVGAFIAFGVPAGLALVAVLTYRAFAFWLPTIPGAIAFIQLRRRIRRWNAVPGAIPRGAPVERSAG